VEKGHPEEVEGVLTLDGLRLRVTLGALPAETAAPRAVEMSISVPQPADPEQMVDYASVAERLASLDGGVFRYVEELAAAAADALLDRWPARRWTVTVTKRRPPTSVPLSRAVYTLTRGPLG
jgi:dihydroneopterin aldolase